MVVLFWGVEQLDKPLVNDFYEENTVTLLSSHQHHETDDTENKRPKFVKETLDKTITEIESFISDVSDKF